MLYNPQRVGDIKDAFLEKCKALCNPLPVEITKSTGYLTAIYTCKEGITVHLLAADYDTDIDHHLDEIRFHRSRVNYVNKVTPIGIEQEVTLKCEKKPTVYIPVSDGEAEVVFENGNCKITLPENCSYALIHIPN